MCHYANVEYKGMTTVEVTDYTNQTPSKHFRQNKCLHLSTAKNIHKCAQNRRSTSSMCGQSLCKD